MTEWWNHIPYALSPIAFTIGFFSFYWYALFFLLGWGSAYLFSRLLVSRKVFRGIHQKNLSDLFLWLLIGAIVGGKIGYLIFYALPFFSLESGLFFPYDFSSGTWQGISGMSYHGALVGIGLTLLFFSRKKNLPFWTVADLIALCAPIAVLFGRLGNFFNGELPGRITAVPWGMYFPGVLPEGVLRHPSSLYEAFFEGIFLLGILFFIRKKTSTPGMLAVAYVFFYGLIRFGVEFFREPDQGIGYFFSFLTFGQIFSLCMIAFAGALFFLKRKKKYGIMRIE